VGNTAFQIIIKTAPAHFHHFAQNGDREGLLLLPDKIISQLDSLAKKAAAFFKISRSISNRLFSFRNRRFSSSSSRLGTPPSALSSWSWRNSLTQREIFDEWIPSRRPASEQLYLCSNTRLMASALNSFVNFFLFSFSFILHLAFFNFTLSKVSVNIKPFQLLKALFVLIVFPSLSFWKIITGTTLRIVCNSSFDHLSSTASFFNPLILCCSSS